MADPRYSEWIATRLEGYPEGYFEQDIPYARENLRGEYEYLSGLDNKGRYSPDVRRSQNNAVTSNQQRIAQWAGSPVKHQNKMAKNTHTDNIGYAKGYSVNPAAMNQDGPEVARSLGRYVNNWQQDIKNPNRGHDIRYGQPIVGGGASNGIARDGIVNRLAGPIGKLPAIAAPLGIASGVTGALNMPEAYQNFLNFAHRYGLMNGMQRYVTGDDSRPEL